MSSGGIRISQQNYYSTHNALVASVDDQSVRFVLQELEGTRHGALQVYPFYDIQMIKRLLIKKLALPTSTRVKDLRILYKGQELPNYRTMDCYLNNSRSDDRLYWCLKQAPSGSGIRALGIRMSSRLQYIFNEITSSMQHNIKPKLAMDGTGGTYEMYNRAGKCLAMFKPSNEEAFTPYNPRGYVGNMNQQGFRPGVLSGEGATREVAAYLLDASYDNFSSVPATTMVEIAHQSLNNTNYSGLNNVANLSNISNTNYMAFNMRSNSINLDNLQWKVGSFQEFVPSKGTSGNYNPNMFSVADVHKIGIFDIRVLNLDRNDGNILVVNNPSFSSTHNLQAQHNGHNDEEHTNRERDPRENKYKLIPIDHGLILPDIIDICDLDWVWYEWPQANDPFSSEELRQIFTFNVDKDIERLKKYLHIRDECLRTMKVMTKFLQIAASMKLNLHQIATIIVRHDMDVPSELELIIKKSIEQAYKVTDSTNIITTNRFGNVIDLIENAVKPIKTVHSDNENTTDNEGLSSHKEGEEATPDRRGRTQTKMNLKELPSSAFFHYPEHFKSGESGSEEDFNNGSTREEHAEHREERKEERRFRTTVRRKKMSSTNKSTWSLVDAKGHLVQIEWDANFQKVFFKILEEMFVGNIQRLHPDWESYPYQGQPEHLYSANHRNQKPLPFTTLWFND